MPIMQQRPTPPDRMLSMVKCDFRTETVLGTIMPICQYVVYLLTRCRGLWLNEQHGVGNIELVFLIIRANSIPIVIN